MNDKELAELLKYCKPNEMYVVNEDNKLEILYCPFRVLVLNDVGLLKANEIVFVNEVKITRKLMTVYIILGNAFYCYHFEIIGQ